jgi:hypothetical protein
MATDFGIVCPLRSQLEPPAALLERAHGEFGLDHVTACALEGGGHALYLGKDEGPRELILEPGWQYPPDLSHFERCELRPRVARWVGRRNPLAELAESAAAQGIRLVIRVGLRAALLAAEPASHVAMRNAWGEPVPGGGPCVCQPAVRELLRAALLELASYNPGGLQVVDWRPDRLAGPAAARPLEWNPRARRLLDVCFCDACRQIAGAAGIDPDQAARSVQVHFRSAVAAADPQEAEPRLQRDEVLVGYIRSRCGDTQRWLISLVSMHDSRRLMLVERGRLEPDPAGWWAPPVAPEGWAQVVRPGAAGGGGVPSAGGGVSLPAWRPEFRESSELVRFVQEALACGVGLIEFERLDLDPPEALTWAKQAVRFGRRSHVS